MGGASIPDANWAQARLPVSMGGFGLRSATHHAAAAYAVSVVHSSELSSAMLHPIRFKPNLNHALRVLNCINTDPFTLEEIKDTTRRQVSHHVDLCLQVAVISHFE